ncbi:urate hydroxylase PuuD [Candidimonas humi]|uniref:Urate hydroxylase PuuD n=1 Tax=Candidimonas humi TaxID=683355 RepID=A0ABV8NXY1_9BURK|nr:urate hydroxylase PuuD [Candidimonas humi]MBV6304319.1 urate hydroxylase PuuD [Candidimonas humi]
MQAYVLEFGNLLLRWLHVVAAIAWIGESIYFVMLDNSLHPPRGEQSRQRGVFGEMWAVHGGGFYHNQKYLTNPAELPDDLHWSFWKSYATWLSGFALFALLYLSNPQLYLVNPASPWHWAASMSGLQAGVLAVAFLVVGYIVYSQLCRRISPNMDHDGWLSAAVGVMMVVVSYLATHIFAGRASFLLTGALMATCMSANVFFWIIPGQHRMVDALKAGRKPDPLDGKRGKQRSVHNTYFTLPVVFLMLSNHYSFAFSSEYAWIIMSLFIFAGAVIRQYFVLRHVGKNQLGYPAAGIVMLLIIAWLAAPAPAPAVAAAPAAASTVAQVNAAAAASAASGGPAMASSAAAASAGAAPAATAAGAAAGAASGAADELQQVRAIIGMRCIECHSAKPSQAGFASAPAGIMFDTPAEIRARGAQIKQVVASRYMPLGNLTKMTDAERAAIAAWSGQ